MDFSWKWACVKAVAQKTYKKISKEYFKTKRYAGRLVKDENGGAEYLSKLILSGKPFMAARYGFNEIETTAAVYDYERFGNEKKLNKVIEKKHIFNNAGFFPNEKELVTEFGDAMIKHSRQLDILGVWYIPFEEYFISHFAPEAELSLLRTFEPWNEEIPWTKALEGKKVLVVHPFEKTIKKQYKNRDKLFLNRDILPEFELITYKAVQTVAGEADSRFETWFDALDYMFNDIMKIDFDIAILGCGAYGFPLASKIKQAGKQAVHMGGATQLLFGIKGGRWDNHPIVSKLYNEWWTRPDESETPQNAGIVENKCYW